VVSKKRKGYRHEQGHGRRKDFFQGGPMVDFSRVAKIFEISFYKLETEKTSFFAANLTGKCQISKSRRGKDSRPRLATLMAGLL